MWESLHDDSESRRLDTRAIQGSRYNASPMSIIEDAEATPCEGTDTDSKWTSVAER